MSDDYLRRAAERVCEVAAEYEETFGVYPLRLFEATAALAAALAARPEPRPEAINDHERTCPDCQRVIADEQREHDARPEPRAEGLRALHDHEWDCRSDGHTVEFEGCPECKHVAETLAATPPAPALHPDDGHEHRWGCRLCGVDSPSAPALDVERLARAIHEEDERIAVAVGDDDMRCDHPRECHEKAARIAREYAALAPEQPE